MKVRGKHQATGFWVDLFPDSRRHDRFCVCVRAGVPLPRRVRACDGGTHTRARGRLHHPLTSSTAARQPQDSLVRKGMRGGEREWGMGKRMTICALASRSSWMGGWMKRTGTGYRATDFDVIGDTSPDSRKTHVSCQRSCSLFSPGQLKIEYTCLTFFAYLF